MFRAFEAIKAFTLVLITLPIYLLLTMRFHKTQHLVTEHRFFVEKQKVVFVFPLAKESASVFIT
jgi:hypothetical protein